MDAEQMRGLLERACAAQQAGQLALAAEIYEHILAYVPQQVDALHLLGMVAYARGETERALGYLEQAVAVAPQSWVVQSNLGEVYRQSGRLDAALACHTRAVQLHPDSAASHFNLGLVQWARGDMAVARTSFERVIQLAPTMTEAYVSLGRVCEAQDALADAAAAYETAIRLAPDCAEAQQRAGVVWYMQGQHERALAALETARQLDPDRAEVYTNLGVVWQALGHYEQALQCYQQALARCPDCAITHWNMALARLTLGHLEAGWEAYEWRCRAKLSTPRTLPYPRWQGESLGGRTILVHSEQGVGDELLFATCLPDLLARAGHVVVECDARLVDLFSRSFPTATICAANAEAPVLPSIDVYCPIGSLPRYMRATLAAFPLRPGYLVPDPARVAHWQSRLAALGPGLRVGLSWRSRANRQVAPYYTQLSQWGAVLSVPGIHWVNVQYDDYAAELETVAQQWGVPIHHWPDLDTLADLDGVAALMAAVDVVIAPDTTATQLASGLGVPVWRLTICAEDEMGLGTGVSPWGPTVRLFRQPQPGDWTSVLARLGGELQRLVTRSGHATR